LARALRAVRSRRHARGRAKVLLTLAIPVLGVAIAIGWPTAPAPAVPEATAPSVAAPEQQAVASAASSEPLPAPVVGSSAPHGPATLIPRSARPLKAVRSMVKQPVVASALCVSGLAACGEESDV